MCVMYGQCKCMQVASNWKNNKVSGRMIIAIEEINVPHLILADCERSGCNAVSRCMYLSTRGGMAFRTPIEIYHGIRN